VFGIIVRILGFARRFKAIWLICIFFIEETQ
jgi:hypothetical protein